MRRLTLKHERLQKAHDDFARVLSAQPLGYTERVSERGGPKGMLQPDSIRGVEESGRRRTSLTKA